MDAEQGAGRRSKRVRRAAEVAPGAASPSAADTPPREDGEAREATEEAQGNALWGTAPDEPEARATLSAQVTEEVAKMVDHLRAHPSNKAAVAEK